MFRTVPLSIIRSFSLYTQQWYMSYRFAESLLASCQQTDAPERQISNIKIYKIYSLTQLSISKLLLKDISHHISQLRVFGSCLRSHRTEPKHVTVKYDVKYLLIIIA